MASERTGLILTFSELNQAEEDGNDYATSDEAFYKQSLPSFVSDEVHAMMHLTFCEIKWCATFWNPLYLIMFIIFYIFTFPGAALHWSLLCWIPVRKREHPEERELRSQGIYTALGVALISIPFAVIGLYLGSDIMVLINEISLAVNSSIIISNLVGLKAMADELVISIRIYSVGAWILVTFLIGLALVDVYEYITFSWLTILIYLLRIFAILVYTIIGVQCIQLWHMYEENDKKYSKDIFYAGILVLMFSVVVIGFIVAIVISEENAWRVIYF